MNIVIDIRSLMHEQRTGVGEYTYELLNALFSLNNSKENQYFLFYNSYKNVSINIPQWKQNNVHYIITKWPNKLLNLLLYIRILKLDKLVIKKYFKIKQNKFKIDIWFSPNLHFINLSKKIKYFLTIHDLSFEFLPNCFSKKRQWWHKFLKPKKQCQKADLILTPSENTKQDVIEIYNIKATKVKVLCPGLAEIFVKQVINNHLEVKEKYNLPDKYILYLGTLEPRKNVEAVVEAFKINYESGLKDYKLIIAGAKGWKYEKILQKIKETKKVKYIDYVSVKDKIALYQMSSLFIYPSLYEGFGFPVLEAMSQGIPVITSNRSSLPEVAGASAYLVNPNNVAEIVQGIKLILSDKKLYSRLVLKGKEQVKEFLWQKTAEEFLNKLVFS